ncbi:MAG TPA: sugar transferase [Gemmatimonadales bacterium]|jgi:lipopolysaccharide/colanic/teichoic acid biosynthesis glycosyltransferase|nr:sugar transferase [Gemmatimonadales bacterium]
MTLPLLRPFTRTAVSLRRDGGRRALNVVIATLALVLALPLMVMIAVLIKLTSRGPVLFAQRRVGLDRRELGHEGGNWRRHADHGGRAFTMYKFRTMRVNDAASPAREVWAQPDDPRITAVGSALRKLRLDELPQLWNVLVGDMNVVGPRPEQPSIFASLREQIKEYPRRQTVLPGITGWAQINRGYDSCVDDVREKLNYDLEYIRRRSALEDLKIMLLTPAVMLGQRGGW